MIRGVQDWVTPTGFGVATLYMVVLARMTPPRPCPPGFSLTRTPPEYFTRLARKAAYEMVRDHDNQTRDVVG